MYQIQIDKTLYETYPEIRLGCLQFQATVEPSNGSFWEYMALYSFYLGERDYYKEQVNKLYPTLRFRYDLLLLYKLIKRFG